LFDKKFKKFFQIFKNPDFLNLRTILILASWLLTTSFFLYSVDSQTNWALLWLIVLSYFWIQTNRILHNQLKPPTEFLIILLYIFVSLDLLIISGYLVKEKSIIIELLHNILCVAEILITGLLLINNSQKNYESTPGEKLQQRVIIWYVLIGYVAHNIAFYDHIYYLYGFQIFLFLILLKKTTWLESLSKTELWISGLFLLFLFIILPGDYTLHNLSGQKITQSAYWISIPYYLFLFFKMYVLATLVKIPIVMIYNHATLSKKLSIAGFFQSSFPQVIQLLVLLFTFYFFIASWQANQLRKLIYSNIESVIENDKTSNINYYSVIKNPKQTTVSIPGYKQSAIETSYKKTAIVELLKADDNAKIQKDYFIYIHPEDSVSKSIFLVKIDSTLIGELSQELSVIISSGLKAYPFQLKGWRKTLYDINYWQKNEKIKVFPFSLFSNNYGNAIESEIWAKEEPNAPTVIESQLLKKTKRNLVLGRLYLNIINSGDENTHYAFDIYFVPDSSFFTSFIAKIILVLIILSFLFNVFVTRRVIKFGEEIRDTIVRKFTTLKKGIREISSGNLDYKVQMEGEDEFVEFANHFNKMGSQLLQTMEDQRKMDRLNHEFQIARNVQLNLLPAQLPKIDGYNIAASFETAIEVGGDFYDFLQLEKNKYLFTIGDVSGKGASAAFYMAQFISLLRYSVQFTKKPEEIAERLNRYFLSYVSDRQIFITAIIGILDLQRNKLILIRAGHNFPLYIPGNSDEKIHEIKIPGIGIGLSKTTFKKSLQVQQYEMKTGDKLILFTDGIPEAARPTMSEKMEIFGEERFFNLLNASRNLSANNLSEKINNELSQFYGKHSRVDDHTTLIIEKI
jgi:serine phosphatase RsbU (regulator of sigma subunit)